MLLELGINPLLQVFDGGQFIGQALAREQQPLIGPFSRLFQQTLQLLQQADHEGNKRLLLSGQTLADELAAVEELKQKIDALLEEPRALPEAKQPE